MPTNEDLVTETIQEKTISPMKEGKDKKPNVIKINTSNINNYRKYCAWVLKSLRQPQCFSTNYVIKICFMNLPLLNQYKKDFRFPKHYYSKHTFY